MRALFDGKGPLGVFAWQMKPVPYRGKRNEPAWVAETTRVLADVKGIAPEAQADQTTANFRRLFAKAA